MQVVIGIFLAVSILVFISVGFSVQYQDLQETYAMAEKTTSFLQAECRKYENYTRGLSARASQDLLDAAEGLEKFIPSSELEDSEFLDTFIRTEHVSGVMVLDENLSLLAQADMDNKNPFSLFSEMIQSEAVKSILQYPEKTYIDRALVEQSPYDIAAAANEEGTRLIFCYASSEKPASDPYELTLKSVLTNNNFYKNPTLAITDGTQVLSTNSSLVENLSKDQYELLASTVKWKDDQFTKFQYENRTYYGLRRVYNKFYVYAVYEDKDIFDHRSNYIAFGFMIYLGIGIIILAVQRHYDKISIRKMEKQLRIIQAISTAYDSTFLLHMDTMELEAIRPSERLKAVYEKHANPYDFLFAVCKTEVALEYYSKVMHFLDLDTAAERLKGNPFLGCEIKDIHGKWFSVLMIPQKYDENGNVQAFLVMTRNITQMKHTEELTFKDQLTGLHNRNYMEERSREGVRSGDFPVSLIMADCNYLKRTNDTFGHEYGDLLLQRIANLMTETIPENCIAMRVGGDEFLILCMQCTREKAEQIVLELKKKMEERSDEKLTLSAAFGISTTESGEFSFEQAYQEADQNMYRDKQASRKGRTDTGRQTDS